MKSKRTLRFYSIIGCLLFSQYAHSQNVGVNVDTPLAMLHIGGTLRVDSIAEQVPVSILGKDSLGTIVSISKQDLLSSSKEITIPFGEDIQAGDLVSIGDGMTGCLAVDQQAGPYSNSSSSPNELIAQSFRTSSKAYAIKAVRFRAGANQTTFTVSLKKCVGGIPSGPELGSTTYYHAANNTAIQFMMVFNPPVVVQPNTDYVFIISFQRVGGGNNTFLYSGNSYADGNKMTSANNGATWTSFSNQELGFSIYEVQTKIGYAYKTSTYVIDYLLDGAVTHSYATINENHGDAGDRMDNIIGIAKESGTLGDLKPIKTGKTQDSFSGLVTGQVYYISATPGTISRFKPPGLIVRKIGFAVTSQLLFFDE